MTGKERERDEAMEERERERDGAVRWERKRWRKRKRIS